MIDTRLRDLMGAILGVERDILDDNASVETIEPWDSLHHMNLVIAIEDEFDIRFPEDEIPNLTSLPMLRDAVAHLTSDVSAS